jgi:hypothetical protein
MLKYIEPLKNRILIFTQPNFAIIRFNLNLILLRIIFGVQSNSVITNSSGPAIFVRYNRVDLCNKMTSSTSKTVRYNYVLVNNRVRYNRVSLYIFGRFNERIE